MTPEGNVGRHQLLSGIGLSLCAWALASCGSTNRPVTGGPPLEPAPRLFPAPDEPLLPAPDLAPLLVATTSDDFAMTLPTEEVVRVRRGETLELAFNRPIVRSIAVGRPLPTAPLEFVPPVRGVATYTSPSTLSFQAETAVFDRMAEVRFRPSPSLASLAGETLGNVGSRTVVFDGTPRVVTSPSEVASGAPLRFTFDGPVDARALKRDVLVYEVGGGGRSIPFTVQSSGPDDDRRYPVEIGVGTSLEPGSVIGVAFLPRWLRTYGSRVTSLTANVAPRPSLVLGQRAYEGSDEEDEYVETSTGQAQAPLATSPRDASGVFQVEEALRLVSTHALALPPADAIAVVPPVSNLRTSLEHEGKLLVIRAEWAPDVVHTVRIRNLATTDGIPLATVPPLAVRSAGMAPAVEVIGSGTTCEAGIPCILPFRAVNAAQNRVRIVPIDDGSIFRAITDPRGYLAASNVGFSPLSPLVPESRPNRWGRGTVDALASVRGPKGALVAFEPPAPPSGRRAPPPTSAFLQSTNLGLTTIVLEDALVTWVTSLDRATPLADVPVRRWGPQGALATVTTDARGLAIFERARGAAAFVTTTHVLSAGRGDDRAIVDAPAFGSVEASADVGVHATVIVDRGIYRPGDTLRALGFVRKLEGARASLPDAAPRRFQLIEEATGDIVAESAATDIGGGRTFATLVVPEHADQGRHRVVLVERERVESPIGGTDVRVAYFPEPRVRLDVDPSSEVYTGGAPVEVALEARYLFGAPLRGTEAEVVLRRLGEVDRPTALERYAFGPVDTYVSARTEHEASVPLDETGKGRTTLPYVLDRATRTLLRVDTRVRDPGGEITSTSRTLQAMPASVEVGLDIHDPWIRLGETILEDAVVIDAAQAKVNGAPVEIRTVRERWDPYWERDAVSGEDAALRRAAREEVVNRCTVTAADGTARCRFAPADPGNYRIEAETRDRQGKTSLASARVFVVGPDSAPSADRPGRSLRLHPSKRSFVSGETLELSFENPFAEAEALVLVSTDGVKHAARQRFESGGQVLRVPITDAMVPSARVTVVLAKPRTGPVDERLDVHAPDVRIGMLDLAVRPSDSALVVSLEDVPSTTAPDVRVPVRVKVADAAGRPVASHVALWVVDEGVLRLTGYQVRSPNDDLFPMRSYAHGVLDLRDALRRRMPAAVAGGSSGDGGGEESTEAPPPSLDRFDPTVLFVPDAVTDAAGQVTIPVPVGPRTTQLRVMAVAMDDGAKAGKAQAATTVTRPVVIRPLLPDHAVEGDVFVAEALVTNTSEAARTGTVVLVADGTRHELAFQLAAGETKTLGAPVTAGREPIAFRFEVRSDELSYQLERHVPVLAKARASVHRVAGTFDGNHVVGLSVPADAFDGELTVEVRPGPFVGLASLVERVARLRYRNGVMENAAFLRAAVWVLDAEAGTTPRPHELDRLELAARDALDRVRGSRLSDGGFPCSEGGGSSAVGTLAAYRALVVAKARFSVPEAEIRRVRDRLVTLLEAGDFGERAGAYGIDAYATAMRVLAESGRRDTRRIDALFAQREFLSRYALLQLAGAMDEDDDRREALLARATRDLGPVLEQDSPSEARLFSALVRVARSSEDLAADAPRYDGALAALLNADAIVDLSDLAEAVEAASLAMRHLPEARSEIAVTLDGTRLVPSGGHGAVRRFTIPVERIRGRSPALALAALGGSRVSFAIHGAWSVPVGNDEPARGRHAYVVRRLETIEGRAIASGAHVPRGVPIRVRLFLVVQDAVHARLTIASPDATGFDRGGVDRDATARDDVAAVLGEPEIGSVIDPRIAIAARTLAFVETKRVAEGMTRFDLVEPPQGLHELTYLVVPTTPGTLTLLPATAEVGVREETWSISGVDSLVVDP